MSFGRIKIRWLVATEGQYGGNSNINKPVPSAFSLSTNVLMSLSFPPNFIARLGPVGLLTISDNSYTSIESSVLITVQN